MATHPNIHPKLLNFDRNSFKEIVKDESSCRTFVEEMGLIPSRASVAPLCCKKRMIVVEDQSAELGWRWNCNEHDPTKNVCRKSINPVQGTVFDSNHCHLQIRDAIIVILFFPLEMDVTNIITIINNFRREKNEPEVNERAVLDFYSTLVNAIEIIMSHR